MVKRLLCCAFVFSSSLLTNAQWKLVKELSLAKTPHISASSQNGGFYIGYSDGSLVKYDSNGSELLNYSLPNSSPITLIEPQFQLKTFLFYYDNQQITILDRFNALPKTYDMRAFADGIISLVCPAPDGTFWLVQNNPQLLKRVNPNRDVTIVETLPNLEGDVNYLKAYQNMLLIADDAGFKIFDQFGNLNYQKNDEILDIMVTNSTIWYVSTTSLIEMDAFSSEKISEKKLPMQKPEGFIFAKPYYVFIKNRKLLFYEYD